MRLALASLAAVLALTGCSDSGSNGGDSTPEEVMAAAKQKLDETEGVTLTLATTELPDGVSGVISAAGIGTHAPAFEGTIIVPFAGSEVQVPVIAADGLVFAQIPLAPGWSQVNPADYGAPDPADLMDPDQGLSSLLTATEGVEQGDQARGGPNLEVVTTYTGTIRADVVRRVIPTAQGPDFDASYLINAGGQLIEADLTGQFYADAPAITYHLTLGDYGTVKDIQAP